jgi:hypothetical protein
MTTLLNALQTENTLTTNGMVTNSSSLNSCVNLFFEIGAMRGKDKQILINSFVKALNEDSLTAMKLLFWSRDIRGGAGERKIFRDLIKYLANNHSELIEKNISLIPEFGRWDDLLELFGTKLETLALSTIKVGLDNGNGLCAKWMPRPNIGNKERKAKANIIRKYLGLTPKEYRMVLVNLSNTVEQLMCSNSWTKIEYSKLPSKAMSDNMKAFSKHDLERFQEYLASVEKGEVKINAGAVYPYDIVKNLKVGNTKGANVQWNALPNYMLQNPERLLPVVDVSGSMSGAKAGGNALISCMDVAISLGLYISERNIGPFKDAFVTFSESPALQFLKGTLSERYNQLSRADWSMSTNLESVFTLILNKAKQFNVSENEMPTMILILSDMQFNSAIRGSNATAQKMIARMYQEAGYKMPKLVYWNLNNTTTNFPVQMNDSNTALVSGFSPSLLTSLLSGKDMSPYSMMMTVVNSDRYKEISI